MSICQQNDSNHNALVLSIVRSSGIQQYATCINGASGQIAADHNRLTDLEADTWKIADP